MILRPSNERWQNSLNNEMALVAELLANPNIITEIELDSAWFDSPVFQKITDTCLQLAGTNYRLEDIHREMKAKDPFSCPTMDELELLRDGANGQGLEYHLAESLHVAYVDRLVKQETERFATTGADKHANRLVELLEERSTLKTAKRTGTISDALETYDQMRQTDKALLASYGAIDQILGGGFSGGQLVIIGARPAVGKTVLGIQLALKILAQNEGARTDIFSLEMGQWQVASRIVAQRAKVNAVLLRNPYALNPENALKCRKVLSDLQKEDMRIYDDRYTINDIVYTIKRRAKRGQYVAIVDYAGLIEVQDSRKDERRALNEVTRKLKRLTNDLGITIILLAQLSRGLEGRQDKKPILADLKESGSLEQDANVVMLLSRDPKDNEILYCDIAKNREGITGVAKLRFRGQFQEITDYPEWQR